ncbi:DivIVA domain-containing protein [Salininema proteolyticum]|uniref:DivIVA domain-containing protein n=1 Tax=Salininema proteolyticum TaxID=1607685 RepID=A0ABV8U0T0_9ACTN
MASHGDRFRRRALSRGYKVDEVDDFLDRVEATLAGEPVGSSPVKAAEVDDVVFRVRFGGYDEWQVDVYLDRVARQLAELEERGVLGKAPAPDYGKPGEIEAAPESSGFGAPVEQQGAFGEPQQGFAEQQSAFAAAPPPQPQPQPQPQPNPAAATTVMPSQRGVDDAEGFGHLRAGNDDDEGFGFLAPPANGPDPDDPFAKPAPAPAQGGFGGGAFDPEPAPEAAPAPGAFNDAASATQQLPLAGDSSTADTQPLGGGFQPQAGSRPAPQAGGMPNAGQGFAPRPMDADATQIQPPVGGAASVPRRAEPEAPGFGAAYSDQRGQFSDTGSRRAAPVEPSQPETPSRGFAAPEQGFGAPDQGYGNADQGFGGGDQGFSVEVPLGGRRARRYAEEEPNAGFAGQSTPPPVEERGFGAPRGGFDRGANPNPTPPGAASVPAQHDAPSAYRGFTGARAAATPPAGGRAAHPYEGRTAYDPPGRHGREEMTTEMRATDSPFSPDDLQRLEMLRRGFQPRRFGSGYDPEQVNRIFDAVTAAMTGRNPVPLSDRELDTSQFSLVQGGYFEAEVESALREIREIFSSRGMMR